MNIFSWLWVTWIAMFIVVEFFALKSDLPIASLSSHIWWVIGTKAGVKTFGNWIWRIGLAGLIAWMIPHFMTGWTWFRKKDKS